MAEQLTSELTQFDPAFAAAQAEHQPYISISQPGDNIHLATERVRNHYNETKTGVGIFDQLREDRGTDFALTPDEQVKADREDAFGRKYYGEELWDYMKAGQPPHVTEDEHRRAWQGDGEIGAHNTTSHMLDRYKQLWELNDKIAKEKAAAAESAPQEATIGTDVALANAETPVREPEVRALEAGSPAEDEPEIIDEGVKPLKNGTIDAELVEDDKSEPYDVSGTGVRSNPNVRRARRSKVRKANETFRKQGGFKTHEEDDDDVQSPADISSDVDHVTDIQLGGDPDTYASRLQAAKDEYGVTDLTSGEQPDPEELSVDDEPLVAVPVSLASPAPGVQRRPMTDRQRRAAWGDYDRAEGPALPGRQPRTPVTTRAANLLSRIPRPRRRGEGEVTRRQQVLNAVGNRLRSIRNIYDRQADRISNSRLSEAIQGNRLFDPNGLAAATRAPRPVNEVREQRRQERNRIARRTAALGAVAALSTAVFALEIPSRTRRGLEWARAQAEANRRAASALVPEGPMSVTDERNNAGSV